MLGRRARRVDPEVRRSVDEGALIVRAAVTVAVANAIVVRGVGAGRPFDVAVARDRVRDELLRVADEQEAEARRMRRVRRAAHRSYGRSQHQFDYRVEDAALLRRRERTSTLLAEELRAASRDPGQLDAIVDAGRRRAADDVGAAAVDKLGHVRPPDARYDAEREERLRTFREVDLGALLGGRPGYATPGPPSAGGRSVAPMSDADDTTTGGTPDGSTDTTAGEEQHTEQLPDGSPEGHAAGDDTDHVSGGEPD